MYVAICTVNAATPCRVYSPTNDTCESGALSSSCSVFFLSDHFKCFSNIFHSCSWLPSTSLASLLVLLPLIFSASLCSRFHQNTPSLIKTEKHLFSISKKKKKSNIPMKVQFETTQNMSPIWTLVKRFILFVLIHSTSVN